MELPLAHSLEAKALVIAIGTIVTLLLSGPILRFFFAPPEEKDDSPQDKPEAVAYEGRFPASVVIGKMENLLTLMFILAGATTGIALIIAGKSLVRKEQIQENPGFFLGGTLVNLTWATIMGLTMKLIALGP